jgi:hypothetical protein
MNMQCDPLHVYGFVAGAAGVAGGGTGGAAGDEPAAPVLPGFEKSTVGASRAPALVTSNPARGLAPVTFAVSAVGKVRIVVL